MWASRPSARSPRARSRSSPSGTRWTAEGPVFVSRFDGEGEGYSVRIPFEWEVGSTYELRVVAAGPHVWEAFVGAHLIGGIEVPARWKGLRDVSIMWTERYAGRVRSCADIAHSVARFGVPTADGGAVAPVSRHHHLSEPRRLPGLVGRGCARRHRPGHGWRLTGGVTVGFLTCPGSGSYCAPIL